MRKATRNDISNARLLTIQQACVITGMGKNRCREFCDRHGATRKLSPRMVRYDKDVINKVLDQMMAEQAAVTETA